MGPDTENPEDETAMKKIDLTKVDWPNPCDRCGQTIEADENHVLMDPGNTGYKRICLGCASWMTYRLSDLLGLLTRKRGR